MSESIIVYGTSWCPDCMRAKQVLKTQQVVYQWIDIEQDAAAAEQVIKINRGNRSVPTILFPDGSVLVEPSNAELKQKLSSLK
jgi:mycoredoxin